MQQPPSPVSPLLAGLPAFLLIALAVSLYWAGGGSLDIVRFIDRLTIRIALVLFALAYIGPDLALLLPGHGTRWLLAERSNVLMVFATAFALHLCAIARFYALDAQTFWSVSPVFLIALRGVGVGFIALMLFSSLRGGGSAPWRRVVGVGAFFVWGAFLSGFAKRIPLDPFYILPTALLVTVMVVKLLCMRARTRQTAAGGAL